MVFWKFDVEREKGEDDGGKIVWEKFKYIDWLGSFVFMVGVSYFFFLVLVVC